MNISYGNSRIKKLLENRCEKYAKRFGKEKRRGLVEILQILEASENLEIFRRVVKPREKRYHFHPLKNKDKKNYQGHWSIAITKTQAPDRLIMKPGYDTVPIFDDGTIKLEEVENVIIVEIETDYH